MGHTISTAPIPTEVQATARSLGAAIRAARLRRRWSQALLAEKAGVSHMTLRKAEQGQSGVAMGTYLVLLWALGLNQLLAPVLDPTTDREGVALETFRLGQRVRPRREINDDF